MKRNLMYVILAIAILFWGFGCSSDDYLSDYEIQQMINNSLNNQWTIVHITVRKSDWVWNNSKAQWEAIKNLPELTSNIYEDGALITYLFLGKQGKDEIQKLLPYVETWSDADGNIFTETISCDYQLGNPSTVAFFIKDSDLYQDLNAPQDYNFRIVLLY